MPSGVLHTATALAECHPRKVTDRARWLDHPPEYLLDGPFLFRQVADVKCNCLLAELIGKHWSFFRLSALRLFRAFRRPSPRYHFLQKLPKLFWGTEGQHFCFLFGF